MPAVTVSFSANVRDGIATHYKREEDRAMESGKLDEELARMSEITEHITPHSLILFNEPFAATNDREGSEISRQVVTALVESGCKIYAVTHLYGFAHQMFEVAGNKAIFLRAERGDQGKRPFRILPGEPLATSYGDDLYREVFGGDSSSLQPKPALRSRPSAIPARRSTFRTRLLYRRCARCRAGANA